MLSPRAPHRLHLLVTTGSLAVLLLWDLSSLDLPLARIMGGGAGFPLRHNWWLTHVLHDGARRAAWVLATALALGVWWPVGPLRRLDVWARAQLAVTVLAAPLLVSSLKWFSHSSCPWDLNLYGGWARYASHWSWVADGGSGHCFPAGHASAGFALLGGYFAFRAVDARLARVWLGAALAAGLTLGVAQQLRGAHFMSHTLWTALACWSVAVVLDRAFKLRPPAELAA